MKDHNFFMGLAYKQACKAYEIDEVPIGAVIVDQAGNIVASGYNKVEKNSTQLDHAEMIVLKKASKKIGNWRLEGLTLYVTVQPCMMCLGAIYLSRVSFVIYGVKSFKYGFELDIKNISGIYQNLHTTVQYIDYSLAQKLLKSFFKKRRNDEMEQGRP